MDTKTKEPQEKQKEEQTTKPEWKYGWLCFTPRAIQCMNHIVLFLVCMCFGNMFQSMTVNGLMGVGLSSVEKRFGFSSGQSSFIANAYDMSTVVIMIIVSLYGDRAHRPLWVGWSLFVLAVGSVVFVSPHFLSGVYDPTSKNGSSENNLCRDRLNDTMCTEETSGNAGYLALFIIGRLLHGVGATPLYTMGVTFMDDCLDRPDFALYVAIFYGAGVVGPGIGYIGGGQLLNVYTDYPSFDAAGKGLTPDDPRWVGAWWLGFAVAAIPLFILTIPFIGFSRDLPGAAAIRAGRTSEAYHAADDDFEAREGGWVESFKELPSLLKGLFTNPTYLCICIGGAFDSFLIAAFTAYGPKFLENQFSIAASTAGSLFGIMTLPGGTSGTIAGGAFIKRFKLNFRKILISIITINFIIIFFALMFFIWCQRTPFAGVTHGYLNSTTTENLYHACNAGCNCTDVKFDPVCSVNNVRYYSPCHAGCGGWEDIRPNPKKYFNCSCIPSKNGTLYDGTSETCTNSSCRLMPLFLVLFFAVLFLIFSMSAMNISAVIRCVRSSERSLAIGVQGILIRLIGTIPGPLVFGRVFDASCILWQKRCGETGACQEYSVPRLGLLIFVTCLCIKAFGSLVVVLGWKLYKKPPDNEEIEKDVQANGGALPVSDGQGYGSAFAVTDATTNNPAFVWDKNDFTKL